MPKQILVLDEFLPYRLSVAANAVSRVIARSYENATDLKTNEWRLIAVLAEDGELSQQGVVQRTQLDKVSVSRASTGLAERGLIRRDPDPDDARSLRLSLTLEGRRLHAKLAPAALALEGELLGELSAAEIATLDELLRRLEAKACALLPGGAPLPK